LELRGNKGDDSDAGSFSDDNSDDSDAGFFFDAGSFSDVNIDDDVIYTF